MAVTAETLRIVDRLRADLERMTDAQTLDLVSAWVASWDELKPEYELAVAEILTGAKDGYVSAATVRKSTRLRNAMELTKAHLDVLSEVTNMTVTATLPDAIALGGSSSPDIIRSQLPAGQSSVPLVWDRMSGDALAAMVQRSTEQIHKATRPLSAEVERRMKRELVRGITVGANPRETARRIIQRTEGQFNGGLTRALTIARTETISAHIASAYQGDQANKDVLAGWEWHSQLGARTCVACLSMHGTEHKISEAGPLGHQNCRCARVPITKSWKDLGFNIEEPPSQSKNAETWFNELTPETQREIMGPSRLDLYNTGKITWSDLGHTQDNPGWRQSVTITPLKDLQKLA